MKYVFTIVITLVFVLAGCEKKQPMQPGDDLFNELYDLKQIVLDSTTVQEGNVEPNWARLARNPIGKYKGYEGRTLLKFTEFGAIAGISDSLIKGVKLVLPVATTSSDTTQDVTTTVMLHNYNAEWDEESESIDPDNFSPADTLGSVRFPGPVDSTAYEPMEFELSLEVLQTWMDTSATNNGILLRGTSEDIMLFIFERTIQNPPYLSVSVLDTAQDSTVSIPVYPQEDYASLVGEEIQTGTSGDVVLQQAFGDRLTLRWDGLLDSLRDKNAYIHSAEMYLVFDPANSYGDFSRHSLVLAQEAEEDSFQSSASFSPLSFYVGTDDSTFTVKTTSSNTFLRRYVQRVVSGDSVNTPVVIGYANEGRGLRHLTVLPYQSKLRLVYSEVP